MKDEDNPDEESLLEENYSTVQSILSINSQQLTTEVGMQELQENIITDRQKSTIHFDSSDGDDKHNKIAIHFDHNNHKEVNPENGATNNDPVKMLLNQPKRSSLKKSCLLQSRINENQDYNQPHMPNPSICEVSSDEESPEVVMVPHFFQNRRKSCYSWRMRQRENGCNKNNSRASVDSEVFEIIHLDESNEEVSNRDKVITGLLIIVTLIAVCYLFWAQNGSSWSFSSQTQH